MKHPANDWEWEDNAEMAFVEWFHGDYGSPYSIRSDWFYGDCVEPDEEQRKEILIKWLHSAFLTGYNTGRCSTTMTEYQPTPQTPEQVEEGLRDAMRQAKNDGVFDEVVNRLVEKHKSQKLWNILKDKWGFSEDACGDIVEAVAEWLPKEQSAAGSQNVDTELLVDGFNHCLQKIKGMLR